MQSGGCTLREATIVGSVVARNSIPMLHSAATLYRLAEMDYSGANSIFLRILLDKKYALPYRVVDAVVFHFLRFVFLSTREILVVITIYTSKVMSLALFRLSKPKKDSLSILV